MSQGPASPELRALSLRHARALIATAELGSTSAAARRLGITPQAVGLQLRELEAALGLRLFERSANRLLTNPAGLAALGPARDMLAALARMADEAGRFRDGNRSHLRLGSGATACIGLLPTPLRAIKAALPGIIVTVATGNTAEMIRDVAAGSLDAALVTAPEALLPATLLAEPLLEEDFVAVVPTALVARLPPCLAPRDLACHPLLLYERGGASRWPIDAWLRSGGVAGTPAMELGSIEAIKVLVAAGVGCSVVPGMAALSLGEGIMRLPLAPPVSRRLVLVMRAQSFPDAGLRIFLRGLRHAAAEMARGQGWWHPGSEGAQQPPPGQPMQQQDGRTQCQPGQAPLGPGRDQQQGGEGEQPALPPAQPAPQEAHEGQAGKSYRQAHPQQRRRRLGQGA